MKPLLLREHRLTVLLEGDQAAAMEEALAEETAELRVNPAGTFVYLADPKIAEWLQTDQSYHVLQIYRFDQPRARQP